MSAVYAKLRRAKEVTRLRLRLRRGREDWKGQPSTQSYAAPRKSDVRNRMSEKTESSKLKGKPSTQSYAVPRKTDVDPLINADKRRL